MQTIQFNDAKYQEINEQAVAAGYQDVAAYLQSLAENAAFDPRCGMSDDEIKASAAKCDTIARRMEAGDERDAREALTELGDKFGFNTPT